MVGRLELSFARHCEDRKVYRREMAIDLCVHIRDVGMQRLCCSEMIRGVGLEIGLGELEIGHRLGR